MEQRKTSAITRLVVLVVLLLNQSLIALGYNPLPFSEEQIYEGISNVLLAVSAVYTWWKNNSITDEAVEADNYMRRMKKEKER